MRKEIHRLHTVVGKKWSSIGSFNSFCCVLKSGLWISIFASNLLWLSSFFCHLRPVITSTRQASRNSKHLFGSTIGRSVFRISLKRFPLNSNCLFGIHDLPGGVAYNSNNFQKGTGIKVLSVKIVGQDLYCENILNSRHQPNCGIIN